MTEVGNDGQGPLQPDVLAALKDDVRRGLTSEPKSLPSRWLYEGAGSKLFELITELDEYYPTRAERGSWLNTRARSFRCPTPTP